MFAICLESSHARGMGHLFRMLTLAEGLMGREISFRFFLNAHDSAEKLLAERGVPFELVNLSDLTSGWEQEVIDRYQIKCWVNDRLDTPLEHAQRIKKVGLPLITFDDRGAGAALSDINIACLAGFQEGKLAGGCVLTDLEYLILNPEIKGCRHKRKRTEKLLITLGGSDTYGASIQVVEISRKMNLETTLILGPGFEHHQELKRVLWSGLTIKQNVPSLIEEFDSVDLAITGGGLTVFEALACGVPCIVVANEPHEVPIGMQLEAWGAARYAGYCQELDASAFSGDLEVASMSEQALNRVPVDGVERVIEKVIRL